MVTIKPTIKTTLASKNFPRQYFLCKVSKNLHLVKIIKFNN